MKVNKSTIITFVIGISLGCSVTALTALGYKEVNKDPDPQRTVKETMVPEEITVDYITDNSFIPEPTSLPTATPELESQLNVILKDKDKVKPRTNEVDPHIYTLEYHMKWDCGVDIDSIEYTDIPMGQTIEYEGMEFAIKNYKIYTAEELFEKYANEGEMAMHKSDPNYYGTLDRNGTYAVVEWDFKRLEKECTFLNEEIIFTDGYWADTIDKMLGEIVNVNGGTTLYMDDIYVGVQYHRNMLLYINQPSTSEEFYILLPKVSGEVEKRQWVKGEISDDEVSKILNENRNKYYRIRLEK